MTTTTATREALTVGTLPGAAVRSFAPTLASLPVSFTPATPDEFPDVTVIDGGAPWPLEVADAIRAGSRGVIVSAPSITDPADVRAAADLAEQHGASIVLAEPYAGDPGLLANQTDITHHMAAVDTVSIKHIDVDADSDADSQLLAVLRTARAIGYPGIDVVTYMRTGHGFTASGVARNGAVFAGLGVRSSGAQEGQSVRGYGFARTVAVDLYGAATASPALISYTNVEGELRVPTVYETADRAAWKRLKSTLTAPGSQSLITLRDFADDLETVLAARP
ncbi:hypothetical protein [Microbacterium sp.]|uniref:hypothetical protein n=1 Tax=Microbacterium sp. TaxID=51671 RepID=UPI002E37F2D6|nr:hypothetical protein [Microbacterium sp.]HEX5727869.1 hypothetical protein [Microbacterium sp.]